MFFVILFLLLLCDNNDNSDPGVDIDHPLAVGQTMFTQKLRFLRKSAVLGLAILLILGGRVSKMFFDILFLLRMCNNIDNSDPGGRY